MNPTFSRDESFAPSTLLRTASQRKLIRTHLHPPAAGRRHQFNAHQPFDIEPSLCQDADERQRMSNMNHSSFLFPRGAESEHSGGPASVELGGLVLIRIEDRSQRMRRIEGIGINKLGLRGPEAK